MSDPRDPDTLEQLRTLLNYLERSNSHDPANTEVVKRLIHTRIRALEALRDLAPEPFEPGPE